MAGVLEIFIRNLVPQPLSTRIDRKVNLNISGFECLQISEYSEEKKYTETAICPNARRVSGLYFYSKEERKKITECTGTPESNWPGLDMTCVNRGEERSVAFTGWSHEVEEQGPVPGESPQVRPA